VTEPTRDTKNKSLSLISPIPSCNFQTSAILRDINTKAKFTGTWAATIGVASTGHGIKTVCESLSIVNSRKTFLKYC
ncbi:hypothetical protein LEMLEM_LOCUS25433, partial [Lemmus lemmus]